MCHTGTWFKNTIHIFAYRFQRCRIRRPGVVRGCQTSANFPRYSFRLTATIYIYTCECVCVCMVMLYCDRSFSDCWRTGFFISHADVYYRTSIGKFVPRFGEQLHETSRAICSSNNNRWAQRKNTDALYSRENSTISCTEQQTIRALLFAAEWHRWSMTNHVLFVVLCGHHLWPFNRRSE